MKTGVNDRRDLFLKALSDKIMVLDGSMGTMLKKMQLTDREVRGDRFLKHPFSLTGNFDVLCLSCPHLVSDIHRKYLEAGADIIETNTFNSNRISQSRYGLSDIIEEMNLAGANIARKEVQRFSTENPLRQCFVAGSIGPTNVSLSSSSNYIKNNCDIIGFDEMSEAFREQARGLIRGGVDFILIETVYDLLNAKAAIAGIMNAYDDTGINIPCIISMTVSEISGKLYSGHSIDDFLSALINFKPIAIGLNCSTTPDKLAPYLRELAAISPFPIIFYPNAGHPDEAGQHAMTPNTFVDCMKSLIEENLINIVGGCCGTTPEYIALISNIASTMNLKSIQSPH